jgi:hypothetical protein
MYSVSVWSAIQGMLLTIQAWFPSRGGYSVSSTIGLSAPAALAAAADSTAGSVAA